MRIIVFLYYKAHKKVTKIPLPTKKVQLELHKAIQKEYEQLAKKNINTDSMLLEKEWK